VSAGACAQCITATHPSYSRAGLTPDSEDLKPLITEVLASPHLTLHGVYCHAGNSYASRSGDAAADYLRIEIEAVSAAAGYVHEVANDKGILPPELVLSVGSTPTAHASTLLATESQLSAPSGQLEVHAGVYPLCDLQQKATGLVPEENLSLGVVARVCSTYPLRPIPQVLIDAGAIAFSKDTGPSGDFGEVYGTSLLRGWRVSKISQVCDFDQL
jgi:D-serine deaminase-like pyridoxal phosphate-dependent protein